MHISEGMSLSSHIRGQMEHEYIFSPNWRKPMKFLSSNKCQLRADDLVQNTDLEVAGVLYERIVGVPEYFFIVLIQGTLRLTYSQ